MAVLSRGVLHTPAQSVSPTPYNIIYDKEEGQASIKIIIRNLLYQDLPDSVFDNLEVYQRKIYDYVYTRYGNFVA